MPDCPSPAETRPPALHRWRGSRTRQLVAWSAVLLAGLTLLGPARAQEVSNQPLTMKLPDQVAAGPKAWTSPGGLSSTIQVMLLLTVLSLAPAVLLMTTCFVRIIVVLGLLRQALGTQNLPPSQVITALALFITLLIMTPVWKQVYDRAIVPYTNQQIGMEEAWKAGAAPVRRFMSMQIERTGNSDDVHLFLSYLPDQPAPESYDDVPLQALLPAFMLSELKTAFLIGFQIYLPFLIVDMVIASVMVSMGMLMVPPVLISLPFKLLLFVLLDGWHLVVGMLMESFQAFT
jgi:flagellar biosynthetic protein FliP